MTATLSRPQTSLRWLTQEEVDFYHEHGFIRLKGVFSRDEV